LRRRTDWLPVPPLGWELPWYSLPDEPGLRRPPLFPEPPFDLRDPPLARLPLVLRPEPELRERPLPFDVLELRLPSRSDTVT